MELAQQDAHVCNLVPQTVSKLHKKERTQHRLVVIGELTLPLEEDPYRRFAASTLPDVITSASTVREAFEGAACSCAQTACVAVVAAGVVLHHTWDVITTIRGTSSCIFIVLWHPDATEDPALRIQAFHHGANMVTFHPRHLEAALSKVADQRGHGSLRCEWCGLSELSVSEYWSHQPLYHIYEDNLEGECQVCRRFTYNLAVHLHERHCPSGPFEEDRTGLIAVVVVHRQQDNKFLMVQEFAQQGFWVPGGGLDEGESLRQGALRECMEEAGIEVELRGVLQVEYDMTRGPRGWRSITFYAVPKESNPAVKTVPDFESAGACWVDVSKLSTIPLRSKAIPLTWFPRLASGYPVPQLQLPEACKQLFHDVQF
eukprot:CAMPEP_0202914146 /NCGR_PEP_ID=MMETSP1392-20130828/62375_1 /ASSEMBLY_ACC=CAM_ASM_000868 /TAXON_ID=225041 /ORGANISM="Chlamydomonas chlamydogama, Strain SAG 11-48b" /LENGTH=371 /DNA_ID=CAMNT_0049605681 /DNA_START=239 /DNA_END=1354 /DNA_ORIENTATION=+